MKIFTPEDVANIPNAVTIHLRANDFVYLLHKIDLISSNNVLLTSLGIFSANCLGFLSASSDDIRHRNGLVKTVGE